MRVVGNTCGRGPDHGRRLRENIGGRRRRRSARRRRDIIGVGCETRGGDELYIAAIGGEKQESTITRTEGINTIIIDDDNDDKINAENAVKVSIDIDHDSN